MGLVYIASKTASADATVSFTTGIDATYNEYQFHFVNMHPATNDSDFSFQVNAAGATGFNETITSTFIRTWHRESADVYNLDYGTGDDQAQGTAYQPLYDRVNSANDSSTSGILTLYGPSSTTYVKHFVSRLNAMHATDYTMENLAAGYINTTSAIDEISFKFSSGNIDAGVIKMYGIAKA
jgi:hypothetical protein